MNEVSDHPSILARESPAGVAIEVEDRLYLRLDASGRWTAFGEGGALFRRTVDGRILLPQGDGFEVLEADRVSTVDAWVLRRAGEILEALSEVEHGEAQVIGDRARLLALLAAGACAERPDPETDRKRFERAYAEPVPILPPHRYRDVVVLPATGCPNHACRFCAFYRDRPFRVVEPEAFDTHLQAVRDLFGDALASRDGVFLGSASALSLPDEVLLDRLAAVERFLGRPRRGIASFHDPDRGRVRTDADWARLAGAGLVEATVGLETGLAPLRAEVGKSANLDRFVETVARMKAGGLRVSVTVLVGLGGPARAEAHRHATLEVLGRMALGAGDRIYLAPLLGSVEPRLEAAQRAEEIGRFREAIRRDLEAPAGDYRIERFAWLA